MSDEVSIGFCTHCGARLQESVTFCPECGVPIAGASNDGVQKNAFIEDSKVAEARRRLVWITVMLGLFTAAVLVIGTYMAFGAQTIIDTIKVDPKMWESLIAQTGWNESMIHDALVMAGYYFIAGGVLGAISTICCGIRRIWYVAFISSLFASLLMWSTVIGLIVGLLVTYMLYTSRSAFLDNRGQ